MVNNKFFFFFLVYFVLIYAALQGIVSSGITYYISGMIMEEKGPVFVTAFNPFNMIIVAVLSSFIFAEQMTVGK